MVLAVSKFCDSFGKIFVMATEEPLTHWSTLVETTTGLTRCEAGHKKCLHAFQTGYFAQCNVIEHSFHLYFYLRVQQTSHVLFQKPHVPS